MVYCDLFELNIALAQKEMLFCVMVKQGAEGDVVLRYRQDGVGADGDVSMLFQLGLSAVEIITYVVLLMLFCVKVHGVL